MVGFSRRTANFGSLLSLPANGPAVLQWPIGPGQRTTQSLSAQISTNLNLYQPVQMMGGKFSQKAMSVYLAEIQHKHMGMMWPSL